MPRALRPVRDDISDDSDSDVLPNVRRGNARRVPVAKGVPMRPVRDDISSDSDDDDSPSDKRGGRSRSTPQSSEFDSQEARGGSQASEEKYPSTRPSTRESDRPESRALKVGRLARRASQARLDDDDELPEGQVVAVDSSGDEARYGGPPPLQNKKVPEKDILRAFHQIDMDHNSYVGSKDLMDVLHETRISASDIDVQRMIALVDIDGDGQISQQEFRFFVYTKLLGVPPEKYHLIPVQPSTEHNVPVDKRVRRIVKNGRVIDVSPTKGVVLQPANKGEANIVVLNDLEADSKRSRRERITRLYGKPLTNHTGEKRKEILSALHAICTNNHLNMFKLERSYYKCLHLVKDDLGMVKFKHLRRMFEVHDRDRDLLRSVFDTFKVGDGTRVPAYMVAMALAGVMRTTNLRKINFYFLICDPNQTGLIKRDDVIDMLSATHMTHMASSFKSKVDVLMGDRHSQTAKRDRFIRDILRFSTILFPVVALHDKHKNPRALAKAAGKKVI